MRPPRQPIRLITALVALLALGLVLAACGGGAAAGGGPPGHNEADVAFLHLEIPHHEHGIEMAMLAEHRATAPEVKALAKKIVAAQEHENTEMRKLLDEFGATGKGPVVPPPKKAVEEREMSKLKKAPPKEFDHLFLESMMALHMAAADLAEFELKAGRSPEVKHLAHSMKDLQVKEAEEMQRLLTGSD